MSQDKIEHAISVYKELEKSKRDSCAKLKKLLNKSYEDTIGVEPTFVELRNFIKI